MNDPQLMQSILTSWQGEIATAVKGTAVPAELLAALVANESGGEAGATRFESATFAKLCEVLAGKRLTFAPTGISRPLALADLLPFAVGSQDWQLAGDLAREDAPRWFLRQAMSRVVELATSYGLAQIMGWHWIEFRREASTRPEDQLAFAVVLLIYFANKYELDLAHDYEKVFRCWNTGRPDGQTFDPNYTANGLHRLTLYALAVEAGTAT